LYRTVYASIWTQDVLLPPVEQVNVPALDWEVGVGVSVTAYATPLLLKKNNDTAIKAEHKVLLNRLVALFMEYHLFMNF
jgi:hypothetical protein